MSVEAVENAATSLHRSAEWIIRELVL